MYYETCYSKHISAKKLLDKQKKIVLFFWGQAYKRYPYFPVFRCSPNYNALFEKRSVRVSYSLLAHLVTFVETLLLKENENNPGYF